MPTFTRNPWQGPRKPECNAKAADVLRQPHSFIQANSAEDPYDLRTRANREHTACFTGHRMLGQQDQASLALLDGLLERAAKLDANRADMAKQIAEKEAKLQAEVASL